MKLPSQPSMPPRESIVPMINVVFLLLIFFLMTATLTPPEPLEVSPAEAERAETGETRPALFVSAEGEIAFREARGDAAIAAAIAESAGLIRADAGAPAAQVAAVLARLQSGGLTGIALVTVQK